MFTKCCIIRRDSFIRRNEKDASIPVFMIKLLSEAILKGRDNNILSHSPQEFTRKTECYGFYMLIISIYASKGGKQVYYVNRESDRKKRPDAN